MDGGRSAAGCRRPRRRAPVTHPATNRRVLEALRRHWPEYLMEAAGLGWFVVSASLLTTALEYPGSPVRGAIESRSLRYIVLGVTLGGVVTAFAYSPWGKQSGAHINPAVTWAFFRLGKIQFWDAVFYTLAQAAGAVAAAQLMRAVLGAPYAHPFVNYVVTQPGREGAAVAFAAEFMISFFLMLVVLVAINSPRLQRSTGALVGLLIATYLALETPLSGMSLNPARSFGSALAAGHWAGLWIYFVAPPLGMLLAAELSLRSRSGRMLACPKLQHHGANRCIFCDPQGGPTYPLDVGTS